jgi:GT2 family glycosyltransferase/glycosyltransferase involved in cell wall biosynthesis
MVIPPQQGTIPSERPESTADPGSPRRPLRICLASSEFLGPLCNLGIGTAYTNLGEVLSQAGHDVTCLYTRGRHSHTEPIEHWVRVYRRRGIRFIPLPEGPLLITSNTPLLAVPYRVYLWLREHDGFDVVHFPDYGGLGYYSVLAQRQGLVLRQTTTVVGFHGSSKWTRLANRWISSSEWDLEADFLERRSAELADVVWSPGRYMLDWARQQGYDLRRGTHVQPYVVPIPQGSPGVHPGSPRLHPVTGPIREIVFFGRQEVRKGLFVFLDAIDRLADESHPSYLDGLTVTILGKSIGIDGQDAEQIVRARSRSWPFPIRVLSDRDHDQAIEYLRGPGRLAVIPSLVENYPNTVLECLGSGIPFLASRVGSIPEQVHAADLERVCFEPDARSLAQRLRRALREGQAPARLAFDLEENSRAWVRWHERLVRERPAIAARIETDCGAGRRAEPTVSVCISHYNRPHLLRQALDSILAQERAPLEVIVVDDGSPAAAQPELDAIADDYDFAGRGWRLVRQENRFLGAARNRAAQEARGDYLLFMDDDNVAMPHEIATFARVARQTGADVLTSFSDMFDGPHPPGIHTAPVERWLFTGGNQALSLLFNTFGDANAMIRLTAFRDVGGFTEDYGIGHEDWELFARLMLKGYHLELIPETLFWYRLLSGGLQTSTPIRQNILRSLRPHLDRIPEPYHAFFEMCIGQSLVARGGMGSPAPVAAPVAAPVPPWPLRYRLADGLNARLKRFSSLHRVGKRSIQGLLKLGRMLDARSNARPESSPAGSAARDGPGSRPALSAPPGANARPHSRRREPAQRASSPLTPS